MNKKLAAILLSSLALNGCVAAPIVAAGAAGGAAGVESTRSGGLSQSFTDIQISTSIHNAWSDYNPNMIDALSYKVFEGRVLIVGSTPRSEFRDEAVKLTWQIEGVRQVINEIHVEPKPSFGTTAKDGWISTQLKTRLIADKGVQLSNFTFITTGGVIYLIGTARDQNELDIVLNHARNIAYVKDVVSYIRLAGTPLPDANDKGNVPKPSQALSTPTTTAPAETHPSVGYGSADSDAAVGSSYNPPASNISSTDLPPVK